MITAQDMAPGAAAAITAAPHSYVPLQAQATPFRERLLLSVLYLAVLLSSIAFIEPSPHDFLMGILALVCLIAGVRFDRWLALPLVLLLLWNAAGTVALSNSVSEANAIQSAATAWYLAVAAMIFACVCAENTAQRMDVLSKAYVATAVLAALLGTAGYFHLFPGSDVFTLNARAQGAFKDPNVYGPFLIWPALIVIHRMMTRRIGLADLGITGIITLGLLLSFSRGAWFHFVVSCGVMLAIAVLVAPSAAKRMRIVTLSALGLVALAVLLVFLLSFSSIGSFFFERAQLVQSYDVGQGGRFGLQQLALAAILDFPGGLGPEEFSRIHGLQPHNVYLQVFMVSGWIGALSYILMVLSTLWVGLRSVFVRTPWQPYMIVAYATFVGEVAEGFIIDTDHWRHFYLLLGMIWGMAVATRKYGRETSAIGAPRLA